MKTEVIMFRNFFDYSVRQFHKSGYLNATDITQIYNEIRVKEGLAEKEIDKYFNNKDTNEFINELCNELNLLEKSKPQNFAVSSNSLILQNKIYTPEDLKFVKRGKENYGTWLHPYLFVDYAMWLNPKFRAKVVIWISDNLLFFRDSSGDAFKNVNKVLDLKFNIGNKYWEYAKVAKHTALKVLGNDEPDQWNFANQKQLHEREKFLQKIENACEFGKCFYLNKYDFVEDKIHLKLCYIFVDFLFCIYNR